MLASAVLCMGALLSPALAVRNTVAPQVNVSRKRKKSLFSGHIVPSTMRLIGKRIAPGSVAVAKRAARKQRNQLRAKRQGRG